MSQWVEPCVLAGTPSRTCQICGAPWLRITEKGERIETGGRRKKETPNISDYNIRTGFRLSLTVGWEAGCDCENNDGSGKALVIDPFLQSGVIGEVVAKQGRRFLGIDNSQDNVNRAIERIGEVQVGLL